MGTRSFISRVVNDDLIEGIYCHWDGGLSWVGKILNEYYRDPQKVDELMKLGNISVLEKNLNPKTKHHSFNTPEKDVTIAYGRDRGEKDQQSVFVTRTHPIQEVCPYCDAEWFYLFDDEEWYVMKDEWVDWILLSEFYD